MNILDDAIEGYKGHFKKLQRDHDIECLKVLITKLETFWPDVNRRPSIEDPESSIYSGLYIFVKRECFPARQMFSNYFNQSTLFQNPPIVTQ